jgi:exoribonuclease-2
LYLARGNLPMFPHRLTTGPFSLRAGERNAAWSIWVELDAQGAVAASGVQRSWVKPTYRLSYRDADELIELAPPQEADLLGLHALLDLRRRWRQGQGAQLMDQLEGRIRVNAGIAELEITEPGPSRNLVAEAMILAGAVVADLGSRHAMALPYRNQLPATLPSPAELSALPPGPVRHAAIKNCLGRGLTSTTPAAHFSLGLQAYVQATSPIRRYGDLLVQRQLLAHSQGLEPLGADAMHDLINQMEIGIRQAIAISREDQRHWQQVWFEEHSQGQWPAIFLRWLRPQEQLGLVHVEELGMDLAAECPDGCQPAQSLVLRVQLVDSLRDQLRLRASN